MNPVGRYLRERFLDAGDFARHCGIGTDELSGLIARGLAPAAAYRVSAAGDMHSFVFGSLPAPGAPAGEWFNPHAAPWVQRALRALAEQGDDDAARKALETDFRRAYRTALEAAHRDEGPVPGFVGADGDFDGAAFDAAFPDLWQHFLQGTFGLCVATPVDEAHIVAKEATQARLGQLTANGERRDYSLGEAETVRRLIGRYLELSMPFSPIEYPRSSRKRLADDMLERLSDVSGA